MAARRPEPERRSSGNTDSEPARLGEERSRRNTRKLLGAGVLVLCLVIGLFVYFRDDQAETRTALCPGLTALETPEYALSMIDGECIGWTAERDFAFSPEIRLLVQQITAENRATRQRFDAPTGGRNKVPYVRVAAFMPMTADETSAMTHENIIHSLQGILAAQLRANDLSRADFRAPQSVGFQVLLVNEGRAQTHWRHVAAQLAELAKNPDHPVVAAIGLGVSVPETKDAAAELARDHIPSVGAVITSTDMVGRDFYKVSPSNLDYANSLAVQIATHPEFAEGYLVFDSNDDNYPRTLREAFERRFGDRYKLNVQRTSFAGSKKPNRATPLLFGRAVDNICQTKADLVFFAGRDRDMGALVKQLATRGQCGHAKPITIATGATGLRDLHSDTELAKILEQHRISILDATAAAPIDWAEGRDAPRGYPRFEQFFTDRITRDKSQLTDGYAIMHHDAMATVVWATRLASEELANRPNGKDVALSLANLNGTKPVPGASGDLRFDDNSDGWPHGKSVPVVGAPNRPNPTPTYVTP